MALMRTSPGPYVTLVLTSPGAHATRAWQGDVEESASTLGLLAHGMAFANFPLANDVLTRGLLQRHYWHTQSLHEQLVVAEGKLRRGIDSLEAGQQQLPSQLVNATDRLQVCTACLRIHAWAAYALHAWAACALHAWAAAQPAREYHRPAGGAIAAAGRTHAAPIGPRPTLAPAPTPHALAAPPAASSPRRNTDWLAGWLAG